MSEAAKQLPLPLVGAAEATLDQYVGPQALVDQLAAIGSGDMAENVWLSGASGLGKTHLLMALCAVAAAAGRRGGYLGADDLLEAGAGCLPGLDGFDLVCVDDLHRLLEPAWQEAWFHRLNRWRDQRCQLVVGSREPLHSVNLDLPDLRSRLRAMTELKLTRPDPDQLCRIVSLRARARGVVMGTEVVQYLLRREPRNARGLLRTLDKLAASGLAAQRRLTVPFVREYFKQKDDE